MRCTEDTPTPGTIGGGTFGGTEVTSISATIGGGTMGGTEDTPTAATIGVDIAQGLGFLAEGDGAGSEIAVAGLLDANDPKFFARLIRLKAVGSILGFSGGGAETGDAQRLTSGGVFSRKAWQILFSSH
jgi:hypothetical protein